MNLKLINEAKHTQTINSNNKVNKPSDIIPDEANLEVCLNCPLKRCKPNCGRLKVRYPL